MDGRARGRSVPLIRRLDRYPAASILKVLEEKPISEVDDSTVIMADLARKAVRQVEDTVADFCKESFRKNGRGNWPAR